MQNRHQARVLQRRFRRQPDEYLAVDVWGQKYWWGYEYPGEGNGDYGIEEAGIRTANELHIPVGRPVMIVDWTPNPNQQFEVRRFNLKMRRA